jgi:hypothetical protein
MNLFYKFLYFLQGEMTEPKAFGWFHLMWLFFVLVVIIFLYKKKKKNSEKQLKLVLGTYGIIAFVLELLKQVIWSFNFDSVTNIVTWDYQWYAFPFQLCTTPIFISLICLFLKKGKLRNSLLSYMAFVTILGSISTIILPDSCFVSDILVNIHTMWLHLGSFVVSVYLIMNGIVKLNWNNLKSAIYVFLVFVLIALGINIIVYNSGVLNGETFNMFYISPYFPSTLPVFDVIYEKVFYVLFLFIYVVILSLGAGIIYVVAKLIKKISLVCKKRNS